MANRRTGPSGLRSSLACLIDGCSNGMKVGADGNLYFVNDNARLIGLTPDVAPGTTQPKKILDIAVPYSCSVVQTFIDGIAVITYDSVIHFYSYSGVSFGQPAGDYGRTTFLKVNAAGRLFFDPYVPEGSWGWSGKIAAYDPFKKGIVWTVQPGTPGADSSDISSISPLPGGGVAMVLRELRMAADNTPYIPTEYVSTLVVIGSTGQKLWSKQLPNTDSNGGRFENLAIRVDTAGKLVLIRNWFNEVGTTRVPFLTIDLLDAFTGNVLAAPKALRGNRNPADGPLSGFRDTYMGFVPPTIGLNTVYLNPADCLSYCAANSETLYPIKMTGLGVDYPRGAVLSAYPRPASEYVALGDSFSSGEGVPPFEAGTDIAGVNTCHRSTKAYPWLIAGTSTKIPSLGTKGFRACSGAVADNIWDLPQANEGVQIDRIPDPTIKLVTISIGGNDMGFADFAYQCVTAKCDVGTAAYNKALGNINNVLPGKLDASYKKILQLAPNAKIYVVGYPHVIASKSVTQANDIRCVYMQDGNTKWGDARAARDIVTKLNAKVLQKVNEVRALSAANTRLRFVDLNGTTSPFKGREICGTSTTSWFQNVDQVVPDRRYIFHPNRLGQEGYSVVVGATINAG